MRIPIVIANWKMHKNSLEARHFLTELLDKVPTAICEIGIAPPYTLLAQCSERISGHRKRIKIGAQNMHQKPSGAFTGEISADMIVDAGCNFVILGHSERRRDFSETNALIYEKITMAVSRNITPILCVGENQEERTETQKKVEHQLSECLGTLNSSELENLIIAYEPIWAIGTGKAATPIEANAVHRFIRSYLTKKYSRHFADQIRIIYGGSVQPNNVQSLMLQSDIDGLLVGGASLDASSFIKIIFNLGIDV